MLVKKVTIIKCDNPYSWYKDEIGETYDIVVENDGEGDIFVLDDDESCYISPEDCLETKELRIKKLNRVLND